MPQIEDRIKALARRAYSKIRSPRLSPSLLRARLFPPAGATKARALESDGRIDEAIQAWGAIGAPRVANLEIIRLRLRRARQAVRREDWAAAVKDFEALLSVAGGDDRIERGFESASLRAARAAQSEGRWLDACKFWLDFGRITNQKDKCLRNLAQCARFAAESADSTDKLKEAIESWRCLRKLDPASKEAIRGMVWCYMTLAREAERSGDLGAAAAHLEELFVLAPDDQRGHEMRRRIDLAGGPKRQVA